MTIRQILYATDLSSASEPAGDLARFLGRLLKAEILLLYVTPPVPIPPSGYFPPHMYQELVDAAHRDAHDGVDRLLDRLRDPSAKVRGRVEEGAPAPRILD